jgi:hypothetical protein
LQAELTSSAALQHRNLMAQRDLFQRSAVRVRYSLRATETASLVSTAMKAGYRQALETTNEFVRIKL